MRITHVTFDFSLWRQRRNRIYNDDIHRAGAYQHIDDFKRLVTGVGLRDK